MVSRAVKRLFIQVSPEATGTRMVRSTISRTTPTSGRQARMERMRGTGTWTTITHRWTGTTTIRLTVSVCGVYGTATLSGRGFLPDFYQIRKKILGKTGLLTDLFLAYYDARRNKRNTINALAFEMNYESNLLTLYDEIISRNYNIKPSICFINFSPVQREIFAADFRNRVIHHLIYNYISPIFDKTFINDSYSCRKGKGTHYGIKRIAKIYPFLFPKLPQGLLYP